MRKVLFLMFLLLLIGLGAAGVKAQVRIGGNGAPNAAAVLDLNVDDSATPAANKGALALPRVSLASSTAQLNGITPITGMLVYNMNASMTNGSGAGMYFWDGNNWVKVTPTVHSLLPQVTFYLVKDSTITATVPAVPAYLNVTFPGVAPSDICHTPGDIICGSLNNMLQISGMQTTTMSVRIICYRPSF